MKASAGLATGTRTQPRTVAGERAARSEGESPAAEVAPSMPILPVESLPVAGSPATIGPEGDRRPEVSNQFARPPAGPLAPVRLEYAVGSRGGVGDGEEATLGYSPARWRRIVQSIQPQASARTRGLGGWGSGGGGGGVRRLLSGLNPFEPLPGGVVGSGGPAWEKPAVDRPLPWSWRDDVTQEAQGTLLGSP